MTEAPPPDDSESSPGPNQPPRPDRPLRPDQTSAATPATGPGHPVAALATGPVDPAATPAAGPAHPAAGYPTPGPAHPAAGYPAPGYAPPGYAPPGYAPLGYAPQGHAASGYGGGYRPMAPGQAAVPRLPGIDRIQPVGGTPYAYAYVRVPAVTSGLAIGSLIAGIASIAVALVMLCFGLGGASDGWGALVAGAFAILSILLGAAGIAFGRSAVRFVRRAGGTTTGAGMASAGMICGWVGVGLSVVGFFGSLAATIAG